MRKLITAGAVAAACLLCGCTSVTDKLPGWMKPYTPDIHQGNIVTKEMVDSLHEGMTRNQVLFLLGSPTLRSTFHQNQWDYTYYLDPRFGEKKIRHLTVTFNEDGTVESFKTDEMPDETEVDLEILGERARESTIKKVQEERLKEEAAKEGAEAVSEKTETVPVQ